MSAYFGYHMPTFTFPGVGSDGLFARVLELARAAEAAGFDLVTVMDHFYQIGNVGPPEEPMLEAYTTLGALAASTSRVELGTLVSGVTYRNPALLAKMVTTLDVVSQGRAVLGIGAAWNAEEHDGYGFDFPPIGRRMDRLDEALRIATAMLAGERLTFEGRYYRTNAALNSPPPVRSGGPRILIGGTGEKRTLRLVARYADACHWFGSLDQVQRKLEVLEEHCAVVGRDSAEILKLVEAPFILARDHAAAERVRAGLPEGSPRASAPAVGVDGAAETLSRYLRAGFGGFTFSNVVLRDPEAIALAGELKRVLG